MDITIDIDAPEPVYEQIIRQVHDGVLSGQLEPGTSLPTVRQLAGDLLVNRNTVARAYKILEDQGVIQTAGRKGTFVRVEAADEVNREKLSHANRSIRHLVESLISDGFSRTEIEAIFSSALAPCAEGSLS
jgi:GntR family transcriptional regulator